MPVKIPKRPSQREIRNTMTFWAGGVAMEQSAKRGRQPEGDVNEEVAGWRNRQPNLVLERNKRRLAVPPGMRTPIMLGWLAEGSADWIGYESVTITPNMIGKKVAVFVGLESKRKNGGTLSEAQETFLNNLKDAGGIAGVVRNDADCDDARKRWQERFA